MLPSSWPGAGGLSVSQGRPLPAKAWATCDCPQAPVLSAERQVQTDDVYVSTRFQDLTLPFSLPKPMIRITWAPVIQTHHLRKLFPVLKQRLDDTPYRPSFAAGGEFSARRSGRCVSSRSPNVSQPVLCHRADRICVHARCVPTALAANECGAILIRFH